MTHSGITAGQEVDLELPPGIPPGIQPGLSYYVSRRSRGAVSELGAAAYLLSRGYDVFRAVSQSCPFDLVAYRDGVLTKVEVKSVTEIPNTSYSATFTLPTNTEWDMLILVSEKRGILEIHKPVNQSELRKIFKNWLATRTVSNSSSVYGQGYT